MSGATILVGLHLTEITLIWEKKNTSFTWLLSSELLPRPASKAQVIQYVTKQTTPKDNNPTPLYLGSYLLMNKVK